jgi:hypothetical protein
MNLKLPILPLVFQLATLLPLSGQQVASSQQSSAIDGANAASSDAERPFNPPKVTCAGDSLTISANNSTLASILEDFRKCSGVQIDSPPTASSSRIFDELGPGPARQVLTALLSASGFDYVIGASPSDPEKIATVVLLISTNDKSHADVEVRNLSPAHQAYLQMRETARPKPPSAQAEASEASPDAASTDGENPPKAPAENDIASKSAPLPVNGSDSKATEPTSPVESQISNMQQMFEQRKKMMQTPPPSQSQ